jgi:hypothetical protein
MKANQIRALIRRELFQPFEIHLADGRAIGVVHPELIMFAPSA